MLERLASVYECRYSDLLSMWTWCLISQQQQQQQQQACYSNVESSCIQAVICLATLRQIHAMSGQTIVLYCCCKLMCY